MNALSNRISRMSASVCCVIVVGLAREAGEDVGRQRDVGHRGAQARDDRAVVGDGVAAAHALEHDVGARLHRQVDVLADLRLLGDRGDRRRR